MADDGQSWHVKLITMDETEIAVLTVSICFTIDIFRFMLFNLIFNSLIFLFIFLQLDVVAMLQGVIHKIIKYVRS